MSDVSSEFVNSSRNLFLIHWSNVTYLPTYLHTYLPTYLPTYVSDQCLFFNFDRLTIALSWKLTVISWYPKAISSVTWSAISFGINSDPDPLSRRINFNPDSSLIRPDVVDVQTLKVARGNILDVMSRLKCKNKLLEKTSYVLFSNFREFMKLL